MIIPPARGNGQRRASARSASIPAPIGGWNARDALDGMKPADAIQLDNFFPGTDNVSLRQGYESFAAVTGDVETLVSYASGATKKLLAAADGAISDITTGTASSLATGFTSDRWQYENFKGYALLFNGADDPQKFNGSAVSSNSITGSGLTSSNLIYPWAFKERVFMVEKNTLNAWYLGTGAITGSATKLDFSGYCSLGGSLVAGGTWTRDGGSGSDDFCVFYTDRGEVLVYQGTDPASSTTWSLVGVFRVGPPVGSRPMLRLGPDLILVSIDGFLPLSRLLSTGRAGEGAISDKIRNAVSTATRAYGANFGWQAAHYPRGNYILFNIPTSQLDTADQYVMNTITGAWCKFTGMNAYCWAVHEDGLYFGSDGAVFKADTGTSDAGDDIVGDIWPAFNYFGSRGRQKRFTMMRPVTSSDGAVTYTYVLNTDYSDRSPTTQAITSTSGTEWDVGDWDTFDWAGNRSIQSSWLSVSGLGFCASPHLRVSTDAITVAINSIDYVFEVGGIL